MAGEPIITLTGNVGADPEIRFTPEGVPVCDLRVAVQPRRKRGDKWEDGVTRWYKIATWRALAESISDTVRKGDLVVVVGRLDFDEYDKDGSKITVPTVTADSVGVVPRAKKAREQETPW